MKGILQFNEMGIVADLSMDKKNINNMVGKNMGEHEYIGIQNNICFGQGNTKVTCNLKKIKYIKLSEWLIFFGKYQTITCLDNSTL